MDKEPRKTDELNTEESSTCPFCLGKVPQEAVKCMHCGSDFRKTSGQKAQEKARDFAQGAAEKSKTLVEVLAKLWKKPLVKWGTITIFLVLVLGYAVIKGIQSYHARKSKHNAMLIRVGVFVPEVPKAIIGEIRAKHAEMRCRQRYSAGECLRKEALRRVISGSSHYDRIRYAIGDSCSFLKKSYPSKIQLHRACSRVLKEMERMKDLCLKNPNLLRSKAAWIPLKKAKDAFVARATLLYWR